MNYTVLVVEDDLLVCEIIRSNLTKDGWNVVLANSGRQALEHLNGCLPDAIVLDIMLPGMSGLELCKQLREHDNKELGEIPILMLTALARQSDKLDGFSAGADDYLTKPFDPRELDARLRAILKRVKPVDEQTEGIIQLGALFLDSKRRLAFCHDSVLQLKPQEFDLLYAMGQEPDRVFSRDDLLKQVWGYSIVINSRTVDVHISRIRQKLQEACPEASILIQTIHGIGYKIEVSDDTA